jgi:hypothetical protein
MIPTYINLCYSKALRLNRDYDRGGSYCCEVWLCLCQCRVLQLLVVIHFLAALSDMVDSVAAGVV